MKHPSARLATISAAISLAWLMASAMPAQAAGPTPPPELSQVRLAAKTLITEAVYLPRSQSVYKPQATRLAAVIQDSQLSVKVAILPDWSSTYRSPQRLADALLNHLSAKPGSWRGWAVVVVPGHWSVLATNRLEGRREWARIGTGITTIPGLQSWIVRLVGIQPWYEQPNFRPWVAQLPFIGLGAMLGLGIWLYGIALVRTGRRRARQPVQPPQGPEVEFELLS